VEPTIGVHCWTQRLVQELFHYFDTREGICYVYAALV
jgi:hypothetical protein